MTGSVQRSLLFLDVDGPLIPFGAVSQQYPTFATGPDPVGADANPLLTRINPEHGPRLAALQCEVAWATTWMADANECIAPRIGLPQLSVVIWAEPCDMDDQDERNGLHWKTRALVEWAAGCPFAWVDDEVTDTVAARRNLRHAWDGSPPARAAGRRGGTRRSHPALAGSSARARVLARREQCPCSAVY
ncbi:hypothetical protein [Streptomyces flavidovirens]|uniref:hypothetical protein n=1 Tax=Streptomyces flavidovirens TaxID=67298 RepID=UPI003697F58E